MRAIRCVIVFVAFLCFVNLSYASANHPKILIIYDMEGVSGVSHYEMVDFKHPEDYARGREFLTGDVNAAIRGLATGGAGSIWVQDGHGSGNTKEPDLLVDKMDPRARFDFRAYHFDPYDTGLDGSVDAVVCIGMHARTNTDGYQAHTSDDRISYRINGVDFTETHIIALSAARWGIPVIMVSGDNILGEQLKPDFPEMEYAVVKTAKSRAVAVPGLPAVLPAAAVRAGKESFHRPFRRALDSLCDFHRRLDFRLGFQNWQQANGAASTPGVMRDGELGVRYLSATFIEGYRLSNDVLQRSDDSLQVLMRILSQDPQGKKYLDQLDEALWARWLRPEKAAPYAQPGPKPAQKTRFFGAT